MIGKKLLRFKVDSNIIRLSGYLKEHFFSLFIASLFLIGAASTTSLIATLLGRMTDLGFYEQERWVVVGAPITLIVVSLFYALCNVMSTVMMTKVSQGILLKLRIEMFIRMLQWPEEVRQAYTTGLLSSKFVNEANVALSSAAQSCIILVRDSLQVLGLFCLLLYYNWFLTLVTLVVGPIIYVVLRYISLRIRKIVKESQENIATMLQRVQESYEAQALVKVSGTYAFEEMRFQKLNKGIEHNSLQFLKLSRISTPLSQVFTMLGVASVVGVALFQAQHGSLTFGEFITFLSAMFLLMPPIQHLAGLNATFANLSVSAKSVFKLMDEPLQRDEGKVVLEKARGKISFKDVFLQYPGTQEPSLKHIDLEITEGEQIAFVGASGSGKTSLVNLIPRFWEKTSGSILLDGVEIEDLTLESLRNQIAIVSQSTVLFNDTIRNNLVYGLGNVDEDRINAAVDDASLRAFVDSLPEGLETVVGEDGNLLSGGQKQRLSIARAILKNAPILILDEPTSALDSESEQHIKEALERLTRGRTCLIVAHRLSTIENADRIVAMSNGEIVEQGTHAELMVRHGVYEKLHRLQTLES